MSSIHLPVLNCLFIVRETNTRTELDSLERPHAGQCQDVVDCGVVLASGVTQQSNFQPQSSSTHAVTSATMLAARRQLRSHRCAFIQSRSHFTFLPCAVMAKRYLLVFLSISFIFAMSCVKGCPFMGKSPRALSAHQKKCEAH